MATYSSAQREALHRAEQLLFDAGLNANDLLSKNSLPSSGSDPVNIPTGTKRLLSGEQEGRVTRERTSSVHAVIEHAANAIVEFPESGAATDLAVAHVFPVDPNNFVDPRDNLQYSLGEHHGQRKGVRCYFLQRYSQSSLPVPCTRIKTGCSLKFV